MYVFFIYFSKCFDWHRISKLSPNFECLFTFCYSAWANQIQTKLKTCNIQTGLFICYKYIDQFWFTFPRPNKCCWTLNKVWKQIRYRGWLIIIWTGLNIKISIAQKVYECWSYSFAKMVTLWPGQSFWQKNSFITHLLFELCLFWYIAHSR